MAMEQPPLPTPSQHHQQQDRQDHAKASEEGKQEEIQAKKGADEEDEEDEEDDPTSLLASLEAEEAQYGEASLPPHIRHHRVQRLVQTADQARTANHHHHHHHHHQCSTQNNNSSDHIIPLHTLHTDAEIFSLTTQTHKSCLVHFAHPDFPRCQVMDGHLARLRRRHAWEESEVRVGKVLDVRCTPFVVDKLAVRVLPCLVGFVDGVAVGRVVGFEGLLGPSYRGVGGGGQGEGEEEGGMRVTRNMEKVIVGWGVFEHGTKGWGLGRGPGHGRDGDDDSSSSDGGGGDGDDDDADEDSDSPARGKGIFSHQPRRGIRQGGQKKSTRLGAPNNDHDQDDDDDWD